MAIDLPPVGVAQDEARGPPFPFDLLKLGERRRHALAFLAPDDDVEVVVRPRLRAEQRVDAPAAVDPLVFDDHGDGWQELPDGGRARYPRDDLRATGTIGGRLVPCVSARLQLANHVYDDPDDVDWQDVRSPCEALGPELPALYRRRPGFGRPAAAQARAS